MGNGRPFPPPPISLVAFVPFILTDSRGGAIITVVPRLSWGWVGRPPVVAQTAAPGDPR